MALPTQYLVSGKNVPDVFAAIRNAKAPERFTQAFLEQLDFKSTNDRLIIGVLKALRFLDDSGRPAQRYFEFLDQTQSGRVLAEAIKEAYADLFAINVNAQNMSKSEFIGKTRTLSQGQMSDLVLDRMWLTYSALVKEADFNALSSAKAAVRDAVSEGESAADVPQDQAAKDIMGKPGISLGGLVYNIEIHLPESRDKAVYDALFRSLREHLL
jgi:hypothetical protein